ncbi:unnamed protein product [Dicrocoelium dendriticum]|nr:unnamed protein product [Dicrocoelium dendriticum]
MALGSSSELAESGSRKTASDEPGPGTTEREHVDSAINQTNTPLAQPTAPRPSRLTQPRTSKSRALERLLADPNRVQRSGDRGENRKTDLPSQSSRGERTGSSLTSAPVLRCGTET